LCKTLGASLYEILIVVGYSKEEYHVMKFPRLFPIFDFLDLRRVHVNASLANPIPQEWYLSLPKNTLGRLQEYLVLSQHLKDL
jgi:hypothetical protein